MKINISKTSDVLIHFLICFLVFYLFKSALGINIFKEYHLEELPGMAINKILE